MITIKSKDDLLKTPSNHPAYHLTQELTESLINTQSSLCDSYASTS